MFTNSGFNTTSEGRQYSRAVIRSEAYITECMSAKVKQWSSSLNIFSKVGRSQPQNAFSALTHGLLSKWTRLSSGQPNFDHLLNLLDIVQGTELLSAITACPPSIVLECAQFDLPACLKLRGLGISLQSHQADRE